jgi:hypothetical protein
LRKNKVDTTALFHELFIKVPGEEKAYPALRVDWKRMKRPVQQ